MDRVGFNDRRWYDAFFLLAPIPMAKIGPDSCFMAVNDSFCELVGFARTELEGRPFKLITHPEDIAGDEASVEDILLGKRDTYSMIKRYITKQGRVVWVELYVRGIRNGSSNIESFAVQAIPLPNHGHFKVEKDSEQLIIRPSLKLWEFITDNKTTLIAIAAIIVPLLAAAGWKLFIILSAIMAATGITW